MVTEKHMVGLLQRKFGKSGKNGFPINITATQATLDHRHYIDFFVAEGHGKVVQTKEEHGQRVYTRPLHGFEIKVSRSDWLREHRTNGEKSRTWRDKVNYWWIVVPDKNIIKPGELPEGWGLLVGSKQLRAQVQPAYTAHTMTANEAFQITRYSQWNLQNKEQTND